MLEWRVFGPETFVVQPWRNGLGSTLELICARDEAGILWRLSIASVTQDGPFSNFAGYDRTLLLLDGPALLLRFEGQPDQLLDTALAHATFSGDWMTEGILPKGPIRDFNLITRRDRFEGRAERLSKPQVELGAGFTFLYAPSVPISWQYDQDSHQLQQGHLLQISEGSGQILVGSGPVIWATVRPVG